jgi:16S rRNA (adenine1518-N6/adenine1519-N6)-dimethyltransferase
MTHDSPIHARKRFGQHFLVRRDIARRIVSLAELRGTETVLEIGPGHAALTEILADAAPELWLVEVDRDLSQSLRQRFAARPHVHVVEADILEIDLGQILPRFGPAVVVANLPYNISTPVLMKLLDKPERFQRLVLMLQREVAERLVAPPGTKTYGALSVMVQLVARMRVAFAVHPSAFFPRPKVESAVVVVEPCCPPRLSADELKRVRVVVRTAFSQRRKQLGNALAPLVENAREALQHLGIDPRRRPETLTADEFVAITRAFVGSR